jgi:hypothetical protein
VKITRRFEVTKDGRKEWKQVQERVRTGFSVGGTAVSILDKPACKARTFTMVKSRGRLEYRGFADAPSNEKNE